MFHAMMVDRRTFSRREGGLAQALVEAGFNVVAVDFRGHGRSGPSPSDGGSWDYDDLVHSDVPAAVGWARQAFGGRVAVMGHSLGGHVAAASLASGATEVDAFVALAANTWIAHLEPSRVTRWGRDLSMLALRGFARSFGYFPSRRLRVGTADEARPYVRDLARYHRRGWRSRDGRVRYRQHFQDVHCPVLCVTAAGDRFLAPPEYAARWFHGFPELEVWRVDDGVHGGVGCPGHMDLVTDPAQIAVWEGIARWLAVAMVDNRVGNG